MTLTKVLTPFTKDSSIVHLALDGRLARITLNRPDLHNAFNGEVVTILTTLFIELAGMKDVRAILVTGAGKSFSAGGDLAAMKSAGSMTWDDNLADAQNLADMLSLMNRCPKPILAVAHGNVMGGGVGLVACADIVIAAADTRFALSEVKLGLTPATISPYVVQAMGLRWARRLFMTGEFFNATRAESIGLIHETAADKDAALERADQLITLILKNGPEAVTAAKDLAFTVHTTDIDAALGRETAKRIADRRASDEAREGISAFLEKRAPRWISEK